MGGQEEDLLPQYTAILHTKVVHPAASLGLACDAFFLT
jgi:hypothetical protein